jgi:glucose/arabinose dehydrogenase
MAHADESNSSGFSIVQTSQGDLAMTREWTMLAAVALAGAVILVAPAADAQPAPRAGAEEHTDHQPAQAPQPGVPPGRANMMMPMMQGGMPMTGMMGQGMMGQGMMDRGMMDRGGMMGMGMMPGGRGAEVAPVVALRGRNLTIDEARRVLDGLLAWHGHTRLKVADVKAGDANTAIGDITTKDGSLVERIRIDLRTGQLRFVD